MAAVNDLTAQSCAAFQTACPDSPQVFYQSVGSKLQRARGGKFPLNLSYHFVRHFDGPNDGLVSSQSAVWGSSYRFVTTNARRGVSHADMVDLNRENIPDFDVREFYIKLVAELKKQGF